MLRDFATSPLFIAAATLCVIGLLAMIGGIVALVRGRALVFTVRTLGGVALFALGALIATVSVGVQGYRALVHEEVAARISVQPQGDKRYTAIIRFTDGRTRTFTLAGDEIYLDAHILKWKPIANFIGLHTQYELDRVTGRYHDIEEERTAARTVFSLKASKPIDLFGLRRRYAHLAPFLDAEYGSAAFVPVTRPAEFELRVSTSGLVIREMIKS